MRKVSSHTNKLAKCRYFYIAQRNFTTIIEDNRKAKLQEAVNGGENKLLRKRDEDAEYRSDERSGEDVSDSDKEFEDIVEIDTMLKSFSEGTFEVQELHQKLIKLFNKLYEVRDLIEFDSEIIKNIINNVLPQELPFFTSYNQMLKIVDQAYRMQIPYKEFWQGVMHTLLLFYHEMNLKEIIPLCYYLSKAGINNLTLDPSSLPEQFKVKAQKLSKTATHQLMNAYIKEQLVDSDISEVMIKYKLAYLLKVSDLEGSKQLMKEEDKDKFIKQLIKYLSDKIEGLQYVVSEFNYDQCIDFLLICPDKNLDANIFGLIIALFSENSKKKQFYDGRKPTFSDVNLILNKIKLLKNKISEEEISQMVEVVRFVLQKAITNNTSTNAKKKESDELINLSDIAQDLELIQILKNHQDLQIVDPKTALFLLFEIQTQLQKEKPFNSNDEASAKISMILHTLRSYDYNDKNDLFFLQNFDNVINKLVYESEKFDEYLDVSEYILLRDITKRFKELLGNSERLSQQMEYLERKVFNYTQLYTI